MKKIVILILLTSKLVSQNYNFSGTWQGTVVNNSNKHKLTLKLRLIDTCAFIYRVIQLEDSSETSYMNKLEYNFNQSGKVLLRDGMSYYKSYYGGGGLAHLKLEYKNGKLIGKRTTYNDDDVDDFITLIPNKQPTLINDCKTYNTICSEYKQSKFIDTIYVEKNDNVIITMNDNETEDDDIVTVFYNKKIILNQINLYNEPYSFPLKITKDTLVTWCACNQGMAGLNTGLFTVKTKDRKRIIEVHLKNDERVSFYIRIKEEESRIIVRSE